ncbi:MAG: sugar fermentation stimulation protein A [Candidatus Marinamargulisbacteria bacterium]|jgi:sugar fermentation stimulation protein A
MHYDPPLSDATLVKRYKRFLADVRFPNGEIKTVFCPNTGRMTTCLGDGWPVKLAPAKNPKRKYQWTLELIHNGSCWICVNTHQANRIVEEGLIAGRFPSIGLPDTVKREAQFNIHTRFDFQITKNTKTTYIEVKSVTLAEQNTYKFPDAVTTRGQKHLQALIEAKRQGHQATMLFLIQRSDAHHFEPAGDIDPKYAELLKIAHLKGVELLAYQTTIAPSGISIEKEVPIRLS